ncbi:MAG: hypothetical protein ABIG96_05605 [Candidatus Micrarchaeota archaeon]
MPAENYEEMALMNSELRFLTVELMKIALEKHMSFEDVLAEYFQNAYKLKRKILTLHYPKSYRLSYRPVQNQLKR